MNTITPPNVTADILKFVKRFKSDRPPFYVPTVPIVGEKINDCFNVIARKIAKDGGSILYGWAIWEWPTIMVEGEFHSVWVSPSGEMIDISPRPEVIERILFVADPKRFFQGERIGNRRMPLRKLKEIERFIWVSQKIEEIIGSGVGEIRLKGPDARLYIEAMKLKKELATYLDSITPKQAKDTAPKG